MHPWKFKFKLNDYLDIELDLVSGLRASSVKNLATPLRKKSIIWIENDYFQGDLFDVGRSSVADQFLCSVLHFQFLVALASSATHILVNHDHQNSLHCRDVRTSKLIRALFNESSISDFLRYFSDQRRVFKINRQRLTHDSNDVTQIFILYMHVKAIVIIIYREWLNTKISYEFFTSFIVRVNQ